MAAPEELAILSGDQSCRDKRAAGSGPRLVPAVWVSHSCRLCKELIFYLCSHCLNNPTVYLFIWTSCAFYFITRKYLSANFYHQSNLRNRVSFFLPPHVLCILEWQWINLVSARPPPQFWCQLLTTQQISEPGERELHGRSVFYFHRRDSCVFCGA